MNQKIIEISKKYQKKNPADIQPGDWVKVYQRFQDGKKTRIQTTEGVVIAKRRGKGIEAAFTVRRIASAGIGVEYVFPLHSPNIIKIERLKTSQARRAKLYFLRKIKSSKITLQKEKRSRKIWEEPVSEEELERIKKEKELAAKAKAEAKKREQEELEKKFAAAQARRATVSASQSDSVDLKEESKDKPKQESGKDGKQEKPKKS